MKTGLNGENPRINNNNNQLQQQQQQRQECVPYSTNDETASREQCRAHTATLTGFLMPVALSMPSELTVAMGAVLPSCCVAQVARTFLPTILAEGARRLLRRTELAVKVTPRIIADMMIFFGRGCTIYSTKEIEARGQHTHRRSTTTGYARRLRGSDLRS